MGNYLVKWTRQSYLKEGKMLRGILLVFIAAYSPILAKVNKEAKASIDQIAGDYKFKVTTLTKDGNRIDISKIYEPISMKIGIDSSIVCVLRMAADGKMTSGKAKIKEIGESNGKQFWVALWEDMEYPVKTIFWISGKKLKYQITFENPSDEIRYGMQETAELVED
jgi:hypothetical protein